ncbi:hypothetical protein EG240_02545 [Paenimyroides tangerinum]|uniref:Uncharacterized protein n=1 Tax=Paenimyroides tangerinum TaxID=2488728 RepID=A0A3P3WBX3_9FLAO|nr:DUF5606 domain-containing protein [Paenimyroides tangerinum]RRJ92682.1 hypothetical protein EG240_02545 [Paenimyroides tangerinum]
MSVEKVLAISGKPGLYELKIQTRSGFIAESLVDGKKLTVGLRSNVSLLSEISIYTQTGEIKLFEIFGRIANKESNGPAISHKASDAELVAYFAGIVPDYDADRVYVSDIKKVFSWYNMMQKANMVAVFNGPVQTSTVFDEAEVIEEVATEEKPKAKKATKPKAKKEEE